MDARPGCDLHPSPDPLDDLFLTAHQVSIFVGDGLETVAKPREPSQFEQVRTSAIVFVGRRLVQVHTHRLPLAAQGVAVRSVDPRCNHVTGVVRRPVLVRSCRTGIGILEVSGIQMRWDLSSASLGRTSTDAHRFHDAASAVRTPPAEGLEVLPKKLVVGLEECFDLLEQVRVQIA